MEKKRPKGIKVLGIIAITLNALLISPILMLLLFPEESLSGKLIKIPMALIPLILSIAGIICGINLLKLVKLRFIRMVVNITIIYYALYGVFSIIQGLPDLVLLISFPVILNVVMLWVITRPKVKEQFK